MYTKYKTTGIIIGGSNIGEASRNYNIFTRDFGLIRVRAQGIRESNSKLKGHLQNLFLAELSLIRGKSGWRVIDARRVESFPKLFRDSKTKLQSSTRILLFLKRMLPEEDENACLFDIMVRGFDFMRLENLRDERVSDLETLMVLRILKQLGYVKDDYRLKGFLADDSYTEQLVSDVQGIKRFAVEEINRSIQASEL